MAQIAGLPAAVISRAQKVLERLEREGYRVTFLGVDGDGRVTPEQEKDEVLPLFADRLAKGVIGGVVLYPENIGPPEQLRALTAFLRNAKSAPVPFIAVDQEGGLVDRLRRIMTPMPAATSTRWA